MKMTVRLAAWFAAFAFAGQFVSAADLPQMKFNDVKEVAPGVFFRYSSISATDLSVPFGGSNHAWIVFEDFVVVIDANFPTGAREVVEAIKKTTDKPIRFVLDTHHHGDHAYGNAVFAKEGAIIVGQRNCQRLLATRGPKQFAEAGAAPTGRKDVRESALKIPTITFDDEWVIDDGKQRVEFKFLGHAHTSGDAVAYLPKHKILCTGDACVNGAFNYMGHCDSASWIRVLDKMAELDVNMVCPGHGPLAGKEVIAKEKRYFTELRQYVKKGIDDGKTLDDITKSADMPWYKEWTGKEVSKNGDNLAHVYGELTGKITPSDLGLLSEGKSSYCKNTPGWKQPRRLVIPNLSPALLAELKIVAPQMEFIPARTAEEAKRYVADADGVLGYCTPEIVKNGKGLRWMHANGGTKIANGMAMTVSQTPASLATADGQWKLWRENVRRFAVGEPLLCVIE